MIREYIALAGGHAMTICHRCGTEIAPGQGDNRPRKPAHFNPFICIAALRERAERAEAALAEMKRTPAAGEEVVP